MKIFKLPVIFLMILAIAISLSACSSSSDSSDNSSSETEDTADTTLDDAYAEALTFNNSAWNYDEDNDVYWQIGIGYCSTPETTDYESMGIYVPGVYMTGTENGDGTYTCTVNAAGTINGYTAETAPIVLPVNTAGYSAQQAPTSYSYSGLSSYLEAGFIYVYAGMRGRSNGYDDSGNLIYSGGAPWGVTDLKAAVRYYRYNKSLLPGNTDSMFVFGHSGGGAQSSVMGATGDSALYSTYLESIGSAMYDANGEYISDAISGVMAWCPITSLDYADEAYEWNMGQYASTGTRASTTWTSALSQDMAEAYATYINKLGLTDDSGNSLTLEASSDSIYAAGSYYNYLLSVIEESLNHFLVDTEFPYTASSGDTMSDGGFAGGESTGDVPTGDSGDIPTGDMADGELPTDVLTDEISDSAIVLNETGETEIATTDVISDSAIVPDETGETEIATTDASTTETTGTTYETAQDYIDSLNSDEEWISYDSATNTATISSVAAFVQHCKSASKDVPAFDDLNLGQAENLVFGNDDSDALHFDSIVAGLLSQNQETYAAYEDWDTSIAEEYAADLEAVDKFGNGSQYRQNMYNPMYYLLSYYGGYQTSTVAKHWRIHTGIEQGDTASTVEMNLALALKHYDGVEDVEFATVWNQGHTTAERTGDSTENFIAWVKGLTQ